MPIRNRSRSTGYVKGAQMDDHYTLELSPDEQYRSEETGRMTVPTKPVNLKELGIKFIDLGIPIHMSDVIPVGKPIFVDHGALPYTYGIYLHPTDYYWVKYEDDPELAHKSVMRWMEERANQMEREALARLDQMVEEGNRKQEAQIELWEVEEARKKARNRWGIEFSLDTSAFHDAVNYALKDLEDTRRALDSYSKYNRGVLFDPSKKVVPNYYVHEDGSVDTIVEPGRETPIYDRLVGYPVTKISSHSIQKGIT